MRTCGLASFSLLAIGCIDYETTLRSHTDEFDQAPSNQVDILWVIDDSTSMKEEQASVTNAAAAFLAELETADMDFHLGIVTTDGDSTNEKASVLLGTPSYLTSECRDDGDSSDCTYVEEFAERVSQGTGGSDQEKGLEVALQAVSVPLSETFNYGFMRDGALLMVIILSDEEDCSDSGRLGASATGEDCYQNRDMLTPVSDIVRSLKLVKEPTGDAVIMSGIIGPDAVDNCDFAVPGQRYRDAIQMLAGVEADICLADYSPIMESLGLAATGIQTNFQLSYATNLESIEEVKVTLADGSDGTPAQDDAIGWSYVDTLAQIQFNGESVPAREAHIEVTYFKTGEVGTLEESEGEIPTDTANTEL